MKSGLLLIALVAAIYGGCMYSFLTWPEETKLALAIVIAATAIFLTGVVYYDSIPVYDQDERPLTEAEIDQLLAAHKAQAR